MIWEITQGTNFQNIFSWRIWTEKTLRNENHTDSFEILKNYVQFLLHLGLIQSKTGCNRSCTWFVDISKTVRPIFNFFCILSRFRSFIKVNLGKLVHVLFLKPFPSNHMFLRIIKIDHWMVYQNWHLSGLSRLTPSCLSRFYWFRII